MEVSDTLYAPVALSRVKCPLYPLQRDSLDTESKRKSFAPVGNRTQVVQPVDSHCTFRANPAPVVTGIRSKSIEGTVPLFVYTTEQRSIVRINDSVVKETFWKWTATLDLLFGTGICWHFGSCASTLPTNANPLSSVIAVVAFSCQLMATQNRTLFLPAPANPHTHPGVATEKWILQHLDSINRDRACGFGRSTNRRNSLPLPLLLPTPSLCKK
jgi:hypothetical protein